MGKVGFAVPILPGKEHLAAKHSIAPIRGRLPGYVESRGRAGVTMERVPVRHKPDGSELLAICAEAGEVFLASSPARDVAVASVEGTDPVEAGRQFAAPGTRYGRWFKDSVKALVPPFADFDQPVPANDTVWHWTGI